MRKQHDGLVQDVGVSQESVDDQVDELEDEELELELELEDDVPQLQANGVGVGVASGVEVGRHTVASSR